MNSSLSQVPGFSPVHDILSYGTSRCRNLPQAEAVLRLRTPNEGVFIWYVPYAWCRENCPAWTPHSLDDIALVLFQFIIPVMIFGLNIPRRWYLELPDTFFDNRTPGLLNLRKFLTQAFSVGAGLLVASVDIILWITCVMTLAGPALFNTIAEAFIDYSVAVVELQRTVTTGHRLDRYERAELIIALLCGNLDFTDGDTKARIQHALLSTNSSGGQLQSRLLSIMNSQAAFGTTVGIPTLFFLLGFAYNGLGINFGSANGTGWVGFAIFWMVLVLIAASSATLMGGNNPASVSVLIADEKTKATRPKPWWVLWRDYYDGELHPVSIWERAQSKRRWIESSDAVQHHGWLRRSLELSWVQLVSITLISLTLLLFPTVIAFFWVYLVVVRGFGCRPIVYLFYLLSQVYLTFIALYLFIRKQDHWNVTATGSKHTFQSRAHKVLAEVARATFLVLLPSTFILTSALIVLPGSIFQIFGIYSSCFCQTPAESWLLPTSQKWTRFAHRLAPDAQTTLATLTFSLMIACTGFCSLFVFLAWWYQKVLKAATAKAILRLDGSCVD